MKFTINISDPVIKSHIEGYTRSNGTPVQGFDRKDGTPVSGYITSKEIQAGDVIKVGDKHHYISITHPTALGSKRDVVDQYGNKHSFGVDDKHQILRGEDAKKYYDPETPINKLGKHSAESVKLLGAARKAQRDYESAVMKKYRKSGFTAGMARKQHDDANVQAAMDTYLSAQQTYSEHYKNKPNDGIIVTKSALNPHIAALFQPGAIKK